MKDEWVVNNCYVYPVVCHPFYLPVTRIYLGERCEYCNGPIVEKKVELLRKVGPKYVLVENVPAGVRKECGMRYYSANVLKTVEEMVSGRRKPPKKVPVPVYSL